MNVKFPFDNVKMKIFHKIKCFLKKLAKCFAFLAAKRTAEK